MSPRRGGPPRRERNGSDGARVLLVGAEAGALAARLELSGYRPVLEIDGGRPPEAVLLAPGSVDRIETLRRALGPVPMLLGLRGDTVAGRIHCLSSGADDFWLPERPPSDLLGRLRLHLSLARRASAGPGAVAAAAPAAAEQLAVADLSLDPVRREVRRGGRLLNLTAREYQLLLLLLRHRGAVVSRERILREIWGEQQGVASNVIEVYVRYLRQKLEQEGERRLIHTVRGHGYSLGERRPPAPEAP